MTKPKETIKTRLQSWWLGFKIKHGYAARGRTNEKKTK